jgi:hypothetical protein
MSTVFQQKAVTSRPRAMPECSTWNISSAQSALGIVAECSTWNVRTVRLTSQRFNGKRDLGDGRAQSRPQAQFSSDHLSIPTFNGKPGFRKAGRSQAIAQDEYWIIEADGRSIGSPLSRISVVFHVEHPCGGLWLGKCVGETSAMFHVEHNTGPRMSGCLPGNHRNVPRGTF